MHEEMGESGQRSENSYTMEMLGFVLKSMVTDMKNAFGWRFGRLGTAKERIGELERRSTEMTQAERLKQRGRRKPEQ